jgi:hypothetical protein
MPAEEPPPLTRRGFWPMEEFLALGDAWERARHPVTGDPAAADLAMRRLDLFRRRLAESLDLMIRAKVGDGLPDAPLALVVGEAVKDDIAQRLSRLDDCIELAERLRAENRELRKRVEKLERAGRPTHGRTR